MTAPLPEADALATPGRECMVALCPALDDDPPPAWEHLLDRTGAEHGWRWIAYAEDLSRPEPFHYTDEPERLQGYRVRVYDAAGRCTWDTADAPPPVVRVDPPTRPRTPLSAEEAVMAAHYRDEVAARSAAPFVATFAAPKTARRAAPSRVRRQCGAILSPRGCSPWHADRNNTCAKTAR